MVEDGRFSLREPNVPWSAEEWDRASQYSYSVWWSAEDALHLARCIELPIAISHGETPEDALHNAIDAVAVVLEGSNEAPAHRGADEYATGPTYTTAEVARVLDISVRRVQALARSRGVGVRRGRDLLFSAEDVDAMRERVPGRPKTLPTPTTSQKLRQISWGSRTMTHEAAHEHAMRRWNA